MTKSINKCKLCKKQFLQRHKGYVVCDSCYYDYEVEEAKEELKMWVNGANTDLIEWALISGVSLSFGMVVDFLINKRNKQ